MTATTPAWVRTTGTSLSWTMRSRRTPLESSADDRERNQLRRQNRKELDAAANSVAHLQFMVRR